MEVETRVKAYRFVAYAAVTFSVVAVLSVSKNVETRLIL